MEQLSHPVMPLLPGLVSYIHWLYGSLSHLYFHKVYICCFPVFYLFQSLYSWSLKTLSCANIKSKSFFFWGLLYTVMSFPWLFLWNVHRISFVPIFLLLAFVIPFIFLFATEQFFVALNYHCFIYSFSLLIAELMQSSMLSSFFLWTYRLLHSSFKYSIICIITTSFLVFIHISKFLFCPIQEWSGIPHNRNILGIYSFKLLH